MRINPDFKPYGYRKIRSPPPVEKKRDCAVSPDSVEEKRQKIDRKLGIGEKTEPDVETSREHEEDGEDEEEDEEEEEDDDVIDAGDDDKAGGERSMAISWDFDSVPPPPGPPRRPGKHRGSRHRTSGPKVISTAFDREPKKNKKVVHGKKQVLMGLFIIIVVITAVAGIYYLALPRVDVELITVYHEATGGASSSGFINVNLQINNKGTRTIEDVNATILIIDTGSGETAGVVTAFFYQIPRGEYEEPALDFTGDHYRAYTIKLEIEFFSGSQSYEKKYHYDISEDSAMNLFFYENISGWAF